MKLKKINLGLQQTTHLQKSQPKVIHSSKNKTLSPSTKRLKYCFNKQKQSQESRQMLKLKDDDGFSLFQQQFLQFQDLNLNPNMYSLQRRNHYTKMIKQYYRKNWHQKQKQSQKINLNRKSNQNNQIKTRRSFRQDIKEKFNNNESINTTRISIAKQGQDNLQKEDQEISINLSIGNMGNNRRARTPSTMNNKEKSNKFRHQRMTSLNIIEERTNMNINRRSLVSYKKLSCRMSANVKNKQSKLLNFDQLEVFQKNRYHTIEKDHEVKQNSTKNLLINPYTNKEYFHIKKQCEEKVIKQFQQYVRATNSNSIVRSYQVKAISLSDKNDFKQAQCNYENPEKRYKQYIKNVPQRKSNIKSRKRQQLEIQVDPWQNFENMDQQILSS